MPTMPTLRCKTAGSLVMLLLAVPMAQPCLAQTSPAAAPTPAVQNPVPLKTPLPLPVTAPAPAPAPATAGLAPPVPATVANPEARPPDKAASAPSAKPGEPAARPEQKPNPKPGPGVNDAGEAATSLHTTKLPLISLIDRSVIGREKREIGHVIDVLVDAKGQPAALVVDVGGFMGMGNRRIAIAWERFALAGRKAKDALQLQLSDAQVKSAPAYDGSDEVTVVQGAVEPPAAKSAVAAPAKAALGGSRVDLGEGLADPQAGSGDGNAAPPADQLNPD